MKKLSCLSFALGIFVAWTSNTVAYAQQPHLPASNQNNGNVSQQQSNSSIGNQNYATASPSSSTQSQNTQTPRFGIVNAKRCLEESKLGKQERANIEKMKQQMQSVLQEKERILDEVESKLDDEDYMDSVSDETASELKRKKREMRAEGMKLQSEYMRTLEQAYAKMIENLIDVINKASTQLAKDPANGQLIDAIFTNEACTFYSPRLDVSDQIIAKMNAIYDGEQKDHAPKSR
jgi:outer membrane protein